MRIIKLSVAAILLLTAPFLFVVHEWLPFLFRMQYSEELKHALYLSLSSAFISSLLCLACTLLIIWTRYNAKKYIRKITDYIFLFPLGVPHLVSGIALITFFGANHCRKISPHGQHQHERYRAAYNAAWKTEHLFSVSKFRIVSVPYGFWKYRIGRKITRYTETTVHRAERAAISY